MAIVVPAHVSLHVSDVVKLGHVPVLLHIRALVFGHRLDEVLDDLVGDEGVAEVEFCDVWLGYIRTTSHLIAKVLLVAYLSISNLLEAFEDLFCGILVFGLIDHEADELLKRNVISPAARFSELAVHFVFVVYKAQTR